MCKQSELVVENIKLKQNFEPLANIEDEWQNIRIEFDTSLFEKIKNVANIRTKGYVPPVIKTEGDDFL